MTNWFSSLPTLPASVGDLTITYTAASGVIEDFGGNALAADPTGLTIDRTLTQVPVLAENPSSVRGDDDDDVALYRTSGDPRMSQPLVIRPNIDGSTIRIYSDENLTNIVASEAAVSTTGGYQPTLAQLLPAIIWDDATDDHGVYSIYITEVAVGGATAEGPAVQYSIGLLDDISFSTPAKTFRQSDNIGVIISLDDHPAVGQDLLFSGDGLTNFMYNPGGTSSARFVPVAAGNGTHVIDVTWENSETNVSATFRAVEAFLVSEDVELFESGQPRRLCKTDGLSNLMVNTNPSSIDVDGVANDDNDQDFFGLEVYFVEDGEIKTDIPGDAAGEFETDGNIASLVLSYDPDNTVPPITPGVPSFTAGEWFFDPSAFTALGVSKYDIDTLRFAYIVSGDDGSSLTFISEESILLFPDPTISITNLDNYYCENGDPVRIRANVVAYTDGPDTTGFINTGYRMWYSANDPTFATRLEYDFTGGQLSNFWVPSDPNQNGNLNEDESGYYRIFYESSAQGSVGCVGSTSIDLQVISLAPEPTISSDLAGIGGRGVSGRYLLEFCEGDPLPTIEASGIAVTWLSNNGNTIIREGSSLDLLNDAFGGNEPQGGASVRLRIRNNNDLDNAGTRITDPGFQGCPSNDLEVEVRIRAIPEAPEAVIEDEGPASLNEEIVRAAEGRSYLYEYCPGDDIAGIDLAPQADNVNDISDSRAHFLLIPEDSVLSNAVSFNENFIDWSADIFGGGPERDTTIYIATVAHDSVFAGGGALAFAGCASEASTF